MRTRIASVATAILLASAAFFATAGTALMATVTNVIGGGANGTVICSYSYDSTTDIISTLSESNSDTISHLVTGEVVDPTTLAVLASNSTVLAPGGSKTLNVSGLGVKMVTRFGKNNVPYLSPPYYLTCGVSG